MAKVCMILGDSGDGKSSSVIVPPNGELTIEYIEAFMKDRSVYKGMDPETTVIINHDGKDLPFPYSYLGWKEGVNLFTSTYSKPITAETLVGNPVKNEEGLLDRINKGTKIKSVLLDTVNGAMNDKEMMESRGMSWDKWYDLAKDFYALTVKANSMRPDLIIYLMMHVSLQTNVHGEEEKVPLTNGKKLEKIKLHSKVPVVLTTHVEGIGGNNNYYFETQKNKSVSKSPVGMFKDFQIPNSLVFVDKTIRNYYNI